MKVCLLVLDEKVLAYGVAIDSNISKGDSFVDARIRVCVNSIIKNVHASAFLLNETHPKKMMSDTVRRLLDGLFGIVWKTEDDSGCKQ